MPRAPNVLGPALPLYMKSESQTNTSSVEDEWRSAFGTIQGPNQWRKVVTKVVAPVHAIMTGLGAR